MKPELWSILESRIRIAETALSAMQSATNFATLADQWFIYLFSWKGVFTAFDEAVVSQPAKDWLADLRKEYRRDPLLHFLYEARNAEEHGLAMSAQHAQFTGLYAVIPGQRIEMGAIGPIDADTKLPLKLEMWQGPGAVLNAVKDRKGREVGCPLAFRGVSFPDFGPIPPARAGLDWISKAVEDANQRFNPKARASKNP